MEWDICGFQVRFLLKHSMNSNTNNYLLKNSLSNNEPTWTQIQNLYTTFICLGLVACTCLENIRAGLETKLYEAEFMDYVSALDNQISKVSSQYQFCSLSTTIQYFDTYKILLMQLILDNKGHVPAVMTGWITCPIVSNADLCAKEGGYKIFQPLSHKSPLR